MGVMQDLRNLENYDAAYTGRWRDFIVLSKQERRIMCMHLGGIIIECLLKSLIVYKYRIVKCKPKVKGKECWYNESAVGDLTKLLNASKEDYIKNTIASNPSHDILDALGQLTELNNAMTDVIEEQLCKIINPISKDGKKYSYIDIRYLGDIEITETQYKEWFHCFKNCFNWIDTNKKLIKEV